MSDLEAKVKKLAEIAALVPENLQVTCFEILLRDYLATLGSGEERRPQNNKKDPSNSPNPSEKEGEGTEARVDGTPTGQADVVLADLHVKTRKFLEKYALSVGQLNNLFYKEGTEIKPLYENLKTTRMSEAQIRITLLQALLHALPNGEFTVQVENVRTECRDRKTLDGPNFAANYKNNSQLFDFDKYDKDTKSFRLSEDGRKELAELIKELQ